MMHLIRKSLQENCKVCGVEKNQHCIKIAPTFGSTQLELDLQKTKAEIACLEYQIMGALRKLRALKPKHVLVITVAAALKYRSKEKQKQ